eukprot:3177552-Prymnesium_polylepis.1
MECEPCDVEISRNCGHFSALWVTREHGITCLCCVTSPIEATPPNCQAVREPEVNQKSVRLAPRLSPGAWEPANEVET